MPTVKINDTEVSVPNGTNMIEAAKQAGIEIPHYCYHPHLSIAGNCRMCLVEVVGGRGPDIACNMQARDGLAIRTDTPAVLKMRASVQEFLLVNHPLDCPICDQSGECRLQDYYMEHGKYASRLVDAKVSKTKRQDVGSQLVLDAERCVQCSRCVRFSDEVSKTGELRLMNRGNHTEIGVFPGDHIEHFYQGNLADVCPVGALTLKDFRFQKRVWYLRETESVCTGCATGCNTRVCHQQEEVFRFLPRRNDAVNKSWMCDPGRFSYKDISGLKRILKHRVAGKDATLDVALREAARLLKSVSASEIGVVLGTQATNEANWALLSLAKANLPGVKVFWVAGQDADALKGVDGFLMDADKNPNTAGVKLLAAHDAQIGDKLAFQAALPSLKLIVALEDDLFTRMEGSLPPTIAVAWKRSPTTEKATVVLAAAHAVEQDGSFINRQGRAQRIRRAVAPAGDSLPAYQLLERLGAALGKAPGTAMPAAAFNAMARAVSRMQGMEFKLLGTGGLLLQPEPSAATSPEATVGA